MNEIQKITQGTLNSHNHALYFGKIVPLSVGAKIWRIIGGEKRVKHPAYTEEAISGGLDFLFENLSENEAAVVVVGYGLSEYCNGKSSVEKAMSLPEEIALIKKLAGNRKIKVVNTLDEHPELKTALENAEKDKSTGQIVIDSVFANSALPATIDENITALQVAHMLYLATQDCPKLLKDMKALPTDELKTRRATDNETLDPIDAYGLFEIAMRITDLIRGRIYQGGIDRQGKYDGIINQLLEGGGKFYSSSTALKPLLAYLKGKRFGTMYINREKNFHEKKAVQTRARTRTAIFATLGLGMIAGGVKEMEELQERAEERARTEEQDGIIAHFDATLDYTCRQIDNWSVEYANVILGKYLLVRIEKDLQHRYRMDTNTSHTVALQILQELSKDKGRDKICDIYEDYSRLTRFIDKYLREGNVLASLNGTEIERPYQHFATYYKLISDTAKEENCKIPREQDDELEVEEAVRIGTYNQALEYQTEFVQTDFYVADGLLLATEPTYKHVEVKRIVDGHDMSYGTARKVGDRLSRNRACELAPIFVSDMRRYDADRLDPQTRDRIMALLRMDIGEIFETEAPAYYIDDDSAFTAFDGEFSFQTAYAYWQEGRPDQFAAKKEGESEYSLQTGLEAACYFLRDTTEKYEPLEFKEFVWGDNNFDPDTVEYCVTSSGAFASSSRTFDKTSLPTHHF